MLEQQLPVLKEQLEAARQASRDRRRAQAVRLVAWVTCTAEPAVASTVHEGLWPRIMVVNHSDSPAYNVTLGWGATFRGAPPNAEVTEVDRSTDIRLIAPGATLERDMPDLDALRTLFTDGEDYAEMIDAYVEFDDADGHRWQRFTSGQLRQVE